jgi:hypothetical protein
MTKQHLKSFLNAVHMLCRLEQFASGAVFCQLLDAYFKDAIPMGKVGHAACCSRGASTMTAAAAPAGAAAASAAAQW